jgi:flagellar L-ring protein FlgH
MKALAHNADRGLVMGPALSLASWALLLLVLGGCSVVYPRVQMDELPMSPLLDASPLAPPQATGNGSLFQPVSYRPLFEDHRARVSGDTLTVTIVEKVNASQSSTSSVKKSGDIDASFKALPGVAANSFAKGRAAATGKLENTFSGKGATENSNDFSGVITVVVRSVLPNGHLLVAGEKQIGINNNVDVLRFTGQVDPRAIQPGNSVQSTQIANVRLEHRGRGQGAEAQAMGWLGRVFLTLMPL